MVYPRIYRTTCIVPSFCRRPRCLSYWVTMIMGHILSPRCPLSFFQRIILHGAPNVSHSFNLDRLTGKTASGNCGLKALAKSNLRWWMAGRGEKLVFRMFLTTLYVSRLQRLATLVCGVSHTTNQDKISRRWTIKYRAEACALAMKKAQVLQTASDADKKAFQWREFCQEVGLAPKLWSGIAERSKFLGTNVI
jgi:hypothetical protein